MVSPNWDCYRGSAKRKKLRRVPSLTTTWSHWLLLHPESTAYNLFDGKKYPIVELPTELSAEANKSIRNKNESLDPMTPVLGIEGNTTRMAVSLKDLPARHVVRTKIDDKSVVVFWYGRTQTAVAYKPMVNGRELSLYADKISPETAPFKDRETGSRWTLAGRAVDGPLRGKELEWVDSIQCRWFAWSSEYPKTKLFAQKTK